MRPLHQILANGTIADNRHYRYRQGTLASPPRHALQVKTGGKGLNHIPYVFDFLRDVAGLAAGRDAAPVNVVIVRPDGYEHNTDDPFLALDGFDAGDFTLSTGNLIGCVRLPNWPGHALNISSRFGDDFLKYIVADADGFAELPDLGGRADGDVHWLLPYLWSVKIRKAWRLGLPKAYATRTETSTRVRGSIDPLSHFQGAALARYRCTYREHSHDNPATRLIARVLEQTDLATFLPDLGLLRRTFQAATGGKRHPLHELMATPPVRNPYFGDYDPVIKLSKLLLREHATGVGADTQADALLFDVSMLFEYFVRKLLFRSGLALHGKASLDLAIPAGLPGSRLRKLLPDLVIDAGDTCHVFDVKYKAFDFNYGVAREDLFQLHTYVGQVAAERRVDSCGFIYPMRESRWNERELQRCRGAVTQPLRHGQQDLQFHVLFLMVPEGGNFRSRFALACQNFVEALHGAIGA